MLFLFTLIHAGLSFGTEEPKGPPASEFIRQALQHISAQERVDAVPLLQKAFETSHNEEEAYRAANILTEILSSEDPRKEEYLLYLIQFVPDHLDYPRWLLQLGDVYHTQNSHARATDWYLRARAHGVQESVIQKKLGWTNWKQGDRSAAFQNFLRSVSASKDSVIPALAQIWIELNELPEALWHLFLANQNKEAIIDALFLRLREEEPSESLAKTLRQVFQEESFRETYARRMRLHHDFSQNPCWLFEHVFEPSPVWPRARIIECANEEDRDISENRIREFLDSSSL